MLTMPLSTLLVAALLAAEPTLRTAREIRFLGREDADGGIPAVVRGVVTHISAARKDLFLQDETAGIYVEPSGLLGACETGDEVEVTGTTRAGTFAPCLKPTKIVRLGKSRLPSPIVANLTPFEARSLDTRNVETSGVLTRVEPRADAKILYVRNHLVRFVVRLEADAAPERLAKLLNEPVRVRGVSVPDFNRSRRGAGNSAVLFTSLDRVEPIHSVPAPIRSRSIHQHLFGFCPEIEPFTKRSLVRGVALSRQLLTFSRQNRVSLAPIALGAAIADLDRLIRRLVGNPN